EDTEVTGRAGLLRIHTGQRVRVGEQVRRQGAVRAEETGRDSVLVACDVVGTHGVFVSIGDLRGQSRSSCELDCAWRRATGPGSDCDLRCFPALSHEATQRVQENLNVLVVAE